jgi:hypothetical protein
MHVQLTRKLADRVDGIDLAGVREGDVLDLGPREAELLIAEGWAVPVAGRREVRGSTVAESGANAADASAQINRPLERMRDITSTRAEPHAYRPSGERVRGAAHDDGPRTTSSQHHRRR